MVVCFRYGVKQLLQLIFHDKDIDLQANIIIVTDGGGGGYFKALKNNFI